MNKNWNINGLILEGICGSGKTTILRSLLNNERFSNRQFLSLTVLTEHHTQRVLEAKERNEGLKIEDNLSLLTSIVEQISFYKKNLDNMDWLTQKRVNQKMFYVFERFHLTHACHYSHMSWCDVIEIDNKLKELNAHICFLQIDESRIAERVITNRNEVWRNYLSRYGNSNDQIINYFIAQQHKMLDAIKESRNNYFILNTSKLSIQETVDAILDEIKLGGDKFNTY